jgi:hypothetical protein
LQVSSLEKYQAGNLNHGRFAGGALASLSQKRIFLAQKHVVLSQILNLKSKQP